MKKCLIFLLILLLCMSTMLCACGSEKGKKDETVQKEETGTDAKKDTGKGYTLSAPGQFPIVDKPVTLKVFQAACPWVENYGTNYAVKWLEEKTNVHVEWMLASAADAGQKLTLMLAANAKADMPDVFLTGSGRNVVEAYGVQGVLMDLTKLIDEHTVNIKNFFSEKEKAKPMTTCYDGNIYFLGRYYETVHVRHAQKMWMNMKWLENLELKIPKTTDDFYNILKAFKDKDANGNGDPNDEIPYIAYQQGYYADLPNYIMNAFVYSPPGGAKKYIEDRTVKVSYAQKGWREGLRYYKKLYDEKLMDNECFSMTVEQARALAVAPKGNRVGSVVGGTVGILSMNDPTIFEFEVIEPLTGPTGLKQSPLEFWQPYPYFYISSYCEHPEVAIRWADAQFYDSVPDMKSGNYEWLNWWYGEEDVGWEKAKPGAVGFTGKPALYTRLFNWGDILNTHLYENFLINMTEEWTELTSLEMGSGGYNEGKILYDSTVQKYIPYEVDKTMPSFSLDEATATEVTDLETNLVTYYKEMMAKFIRGEASLENDWDSYLNELEKIGLKRYLEIYQKSYDKQAS
jgi:putative aldouronate transport system substrate-binding protein